MKPVSPEIFALKWGCKFEELHLHGKVIFSDRGRRAAGDFNIYLTAVVDYAVKLLAAVLWTQYEAKSIGLVIDAREEMPAKVWANLDGAKVLLGFVLEKFQGAKNRELLFDFAQWNEVPLSLRRRINNFVATMGDMKASGHLTADRVRLRQAMEGMGSDEKFIEKAESLCND